MTLDSNLFASNQSVSYTTRSPCIDVIMIMIDQRVSTQPVKRVGGGGQRGRERSGGEGDNDDDL